MSDFSKGIACMVVGTFLLTSHDAVSKYMTSTFSVGEVLIYRSLVPALVLAAILIRAGGFSALIPRAPAPNLLRGALAAATSFLVVAAYAAIPLADALTIVFASPIFVTAFSAPMLGERVGWRRWSAVLLGFAGVLLMVEPGSGLIRIGALIAVAAALASAFRDIVTRKLGGADSTTNIMLYTTLATGFAGIVSLSFSNTRLPTAFEFVVMSVAGLLATSAHWLMIRALQLAEASFVIPLRYLAIVYAAFYGYLVFDEVPGVAQMVGALIVVGSGVFILRRQ